MVKDLFNMDVKECEFACDSIEFDSDELHEFTGLPKKVLGHSLALYENNEFKVLIEIVTDLNTSKIFTIQIQNFDKENRDE